MEKIRRTKSSLSKIVKLGTVRSRITGIIMLISMLSMIVVGILISALQYERICESIDSHLEHTENEVREFAKRAASDVTIKTTADFLEQFFRHQIPVEDEGMLGFIDGKFTYHQGDFGEPVHNDRQLIQQLSPYTTSSTTQWKQLTTDRASYAVLTIPVKVAQDKDAAIAFAINRNARMEPVTDFLENYIVISLITVALVSAAAWWASRKVMAPLTRLRHLTSSITEHNLDQRLPVEETSEDLAALSESFNAMIDRMQAAFTSQYQLLDDAGHELRTPVTIIQGHLELMDAHNPNDVEETRTLALGELGRMKRLTDDLVLLAKTERPDFLHLSPVDVSDLMTDTFTHAQQLGNREWILGECAAVVVNADAQRLTQALLQLAANAVKFSAEGSHINISARILTSGKTQQLWLSVKDEGIGIEAEQLGKIFTRFARVDTNKPGAGLGLTIVTAIARAHGGGIEVDSTPGVGSQFSIVLPLDCTQTEGE